MQHDLWVHLAVMNIIHYLILLIFNNQITSLMEILNNIHFIFTYEMAIKRGEIMNVFDIFQL